MTPIEVARHEIGTTEYPRNSNLVKYNTWYYGEAVQGNDFPWCMVFVQWCFNVANIPIHRSASCSEFLNWYKQYKPNLIRNKPEPNAILIYDFGHCGICVSATDKSVTAIEGNTSYMNQANGGAVMERVRDIKTVKGVIAPLEIPKWAIGEYTKAIDLGITDGTNPFENIPRYQAAIMASRCKE